MSSSSGGVFNDRPQSLAGYEWRRPARRRDVNPNYVSTKTPLIAAVEVSNKELVQRLLSEGANVNAFYSDMGMRHTALKQALLEEVDPEIIEMLLDHGADLNFAAGEENLLPVQLVSHFENSEQIQLLFKYGALPVKIPSTKLTSSRFGTSVEANNFMEKEYMNFKMKQKRVKKKKTKGTTFNSRV